MPKIQTFPGAIIPMLPNAGNEIVCDVSQETRSTGGNPATAIIDILQNPAGDSAGRAPNPIVFLGRNIYFSGSNFSGTIACFGKTILEIANDLANHINSIPDIDFASAVAAPLVSGARVTVEVRREQRSDPWLGTNPALWPGIFAFNWQSDSYPNRESVLVQLGFGDRWNNGLYTANHTEPFLVNSDNIYTHQSIPPVNEFRAVPAESSPITPYATSSPTRAGQFLVETHEYTNPRRAINLIVEERDRLFYHNYFPYTPNQEVWWATDRYFFNLASNQHCYAGLYIAQGPAMSETQKIVVIKYQDTVNPANNAEIQVISTLEGQYYHIPVSNQEMPISMRNSQQVTVQAFFTDRNNAVQPYSRPITINHTGVCDDCVSQVFFLGKKGNWDSLMVSAKMSGSYNIEQVSGERESMTDYTIASYREGQKPDNSYVNKYGSETIDAKILVNMQHKSFICLLESMMASNQIYLKDTDNNGREYFRQVQLETKSIALLSSTATMQEITIRFSFLKNDAVHGLSGR